jgi:hypothetical protein
MVWGLVWEAEQEGVETLSVHKGGRSNGRDDETHMHTYQRGSAGSD